MRYWALLIFLVCNAQSFDDARRLHEAGRLAEAEQAYRAIIRKGAASAEVWGNLGALLARQDRFDEAIQAYRGALKLAPNLAPLHLNLGLAYFKAARFEPAYDAFSTFLKSAPTHRQALQLRALSALELERWTDAAAGYRALLPTSDITIRLGLATALTRLGKPDEARAALGDAAGDENSAEVQFLLGQTLAEEDQLDAALAAFEKALKLNPKLPQLRLNIGAIYWKKKDTEAAIQVWREEYSANPSAFTPNYTLGAALSLNPQTRAEAEKYLRAAVRLKPAHAGARFHLGKLLWQRSKDPAALPLIESAAKANPDLREARFLLATIYQSLGRKTEAAREFAAVKRISEMEIKRSRDLFEGEQ